MSILNKLQRDGSVLSRGNGSTPATPDFPVSKLHNTYSLDGSPNQTDKPSPSTLDLEGKTPTKYKDNLPQ